MRSPLLGWQPSRLLSARAEAERVFAVAERLGSVNAAAQELGTTWPSLRKPSPATAWACPPATPKPSASGPSPPPPGHSGQPVTPPLDPVFVALNPQALPARPRTPAELYQWVRRDEEYATLGAKVVVELNSESRARQPTTRAWAIIRRGERAHRHPSDRQAVASAGGPTGPPAATAPADLPTRGAGMVPMPADRTPPPNSHRRRRTARTRGWLRATQPGIKAA